VPSAVAAVCRGINGCSGGAVATLVATALALVLSTARPFAVPWKNVAGPWVQLCVLTAAVSTFGGAQDPSRASTWRLIGRFAMYGASATSGLCVCATVLGVYLQRSRARRPPQAVGDGPSNGGGAEQDDERGTMMMLSPCAPLLRIPPPPQAALKGSKSSASATQSAGGVSRLEADGTPSGTAGASGKVAEKRARRSNPLPGRN
jgi:hypothetical protein